MSRLYSKLGGNAERETNGVYLDLTVVRLKIARAGGGNKAFHAGMASLQTKHGKAISNNLLPNEQSVAIMQRFYAEVLIKGWDYPDPNNDGAWLPGVELPDGSIGEVTADNMVIALEALPNLWQEVFDFANSLKYFNDEFIKATAGN